MKAPTALLLCVAGFGAAGAHADPTTVTLGPAEYRAVQLAKDVDPFAWAERAGIEPAELVRLSKGGSIVRFPMDEGVWRARRGALCTETGAVSCDTDYCQSDFQDRGPAAEAPATEASTPETQAAADVEQAVVVRQLDGRMRMADTLLAPQTRIALVPRAPDLASLFAADPSVTELADALPGTQSCSAPSGDSLRFVTVGNDGNFTVPLPQDGSIDRGCWEIVATNQCESRVRPLSDVLPEFEPRRVLAVVDLAQTPAGADQALLAALTAATGLRALDATTLASINKAVVRFELPNAGQSAEAAVLALGAQPGVQYAQHEYRHRTMATFDDPFAWMNYSIRQTGADRLHPRVQGEGVEIAVIDTGVDTAHPELTNRVAESLDFTGFGTSADRHGTAVAGIMAAEANNAIGTYGIAPAAKVVAAKACQPEHKDGVQGRCWSSTLAKALDAVLKRGTRIVNLSLSGPDDRVVREVLEKALASGRLVVAAAGNGGPDAAPSFPASLPGVMAITAVDARERPYPQATRGDFVDIAAPGVEVPVPVPGGTYPGQLSGTSMATAGVAAVAALLLSEKPDIETAALKTALESSAIPSQRTSDRPLTGKGRVDACGAARALDLPAACQEQAP